MVLSNTVEKIRAKKVLFIKLGQGGVDEKEAIEKRGILKLGYTQVDHKLCLRGHWDKVNQFFKHEIKSRTNVASSHTNQIRQFYEEDDCTLWITFYANKLWWCFSKPLVSIEKDKTKIRKVIGSWSDRNIKGELLLFEKLSGKLLKTQGYRGTICEVPEANYVLEKINGLKSKEVEDVETAMMQLSTTLIILIQRLQWQDFETLVDLIFRTGGWQRVSTIGKTQKTLDLELFAPVTGERAIVQVKAQSYLSELKSYEEKFAVMRDYQKFFYVVHTVDEGIRKYQSKSNVKIYLVAEIAQLTIAAGLVEWVIRKSS